MKDPLKHLKNILQDLASTPYAIAALGVLSFAEGIFCPITPIVMLAPLCLLRPRRFPLYALTVTITGELGLIVIWLIGFYYAGPHLVSLLEDTNLESTLSAYQGSYNLPLRLPLLAAAAFLPAPYNLTALCDAMLCAADPGTQRQGWTQLGVFIALSLPARGLRFGLECLLLSQGARLLPCLYAPNRNLPTARCSITDAGHDLLKKEKS